MKRNETKNKTKQYKTANHNITKQERKTKTTTTKKQENIIIIK